MGLMSMLCIFTANAQEGYSLEQAVQYALANNENVRNAALAIEDASSQIGETLADGLPQINGSFNYTNNTEIPTSFVPAILFDNTAEPGDLAPVQFGSQHVGSMNLTLNQMIFDGSFFVGLQASRTLQGLTKKDKEKSEIDIVEAVNKAFYTVLINEERLKLVEVNLTTLEKTLEETQAMYENGFAEKLDVSRLKVQFNNLKTERQNITHGIQISYNLLKFQMGMPISENLSITGDLDVFDFTVPEENISGFQYGDRVEVQQVNYQKKLAELDLKNLQVKYLPKVTFNAGIGQSSGANTFSDFTNSDSWFSSSYIGLSLNLPIFEGFRKKHGAQRKRIQISTIDNQYKLLTNNIDSEIVAARLSLENGLEKLEVQRENMNLAREVYDVTREKYREGIGSNLEVLNAENDQKEAETNYFSALYDAIIAKIDLDKALGKLHQ